MNIKSILISVPFLFISLNGYCQNCAYGVEATMTPPPVNCSYSPGDSVEICYSVAGFTQFDNSYIDGFVFDIGAGWDTSTLKIVQFPYSCSGIGTWGYFIRDSSYASDSVFGKGIYYYGTYVTFRPQDSLPGANEGDDNAGGYCTWNFCLTMKVGNNCSGDLHFGVRVTPDGLTGDGYYPPDCTSPLIYSDSICGADITSICDTLTNTLTLKELTLNLFPDPVNSLLTIGPITADLSNVKILVYSMDGRLINLPLNIKQSSVGGGMIYLNTSDLVHGMYIVSVANEVSDINSKFTVVGH